MVDLPSRTGYPLHLPGRTDDPIGRNRVAVGTVPPVRPLAQLRRPRLDVLQPLAVPFDVGHPARRQHAGDFLHGHVAELLGNEQVHKTIGVGKPPAVEPNRRRRALDPEPAEMLAGRRHVGGTRTQALHEVSIICPQRRGKPAVAATDVHDHPARYARGFENFSGERLFAALGRGLGGVERGGKCDDYQNR